MTHKSLAAHVGEVLADARATSGRTTREIADAMGKTHPALVDVEAGRKNLTVGRLEEIAAAYGGRLEVRFVPLEDQPHGAAS